ncbi:MAG: hypothetical protein NZT92_23700 [Abditibacteriales bacterium]|nr:hypothetical protein [Abditibacteriales bacterium]MDW8368552.1 hypothetical protein [Abditibacteriales bacterium]
MKRVIWLVVPLMVAGFCGVSTSYAAKEKKARHEGADDQVQLARRGGGGGKPGGVRRKINLSGEAIGGVTPKGKAEFRARGRQTKFKVEVERFNLPNGTVLTVRVNGTPVGTLTLNMRTGELELNSNDGDTVPAIRRRDQVTVTDARGAVLLSGHF